MELFRFKSKAGKFGDDLNVWLWPRLSPDFADSGDSRLWLGIGTVLSCYSVTGSCRPLA